jgi:hypothetical protein
MVSKKSVSSLIPFFLAGISGCAASPRHVADNLYDEPALRVPIGAEAEQVFTRAPWELRNNDDGRSRYLREAQLTLPDSAESFALDETFVYAADGSDVQLVYVSWPPGAREQSRIVVRVSVQRAKTELETEWSAFDRRWHQMQAGTLAGPLPVPAQYPSDTKRKAWVLPVGDGYGAPAFEQIVLFHSGGWSVRFKLACAAKTIDAAAPRILPFLRRLYPAANAPTQEAE